MVAIEIDQLEITVREFLISRGLSHDASNAIASDLIDAELEGKSTHGLGKLFLIDELLAARQGDPIVARAFGAIELVDAKRSLGQIAASFAVHRVLDLVRQHGVAAVGIVNMARYARLAFIGNLLAEKGLVGIVTNDAGPAAVVPFGGKDPILGTNPVCFAFPSNPPVIIDFSTSKEPWGAIRQAMLTGKALPDGAFLDKDGEESNDPARVEAVKPFGEAKGYALCVALEVLCGGMLTGIVGTDVASEYDLGSLIIAIDPTVFGTDLSSSVERLRSQVESSRGHPRIPGDGARSRRLGARRRGWIDLQEDMWGDLVSMSRGAASSLQVNDKTN